MNASAMVLSVLGIHLTASGAATNLWNLIRKRTAVSPARVPSEAKLVNLSIMRDSASAEPTSSELERRMEFLEHQMLESYKRAQKLHSVQKVTRAALNELRKDHTELIEDTDRRISRASQESIEINAVGIPFEVAGICSGYGQLCGLTFGPRWP